MSEATAPEVGDTEAGALECGIDELRAALTSRGLAMVGAFVGLAFRDPARHDEVLDRAIVVARLLRASGGTLLIAAEAGDARRRDSG